MGIQQSRFDSLAITKKLAHGGVAAIVAVFKAGLYLALNVTPVICIFHPDFGGGAVEHGLLPVLDHVVVAHHQGAGLIFGRHMGFLRIPGLIFGWFALPISHYNREFCI